MVKIAEKNEGAEEGSRRRMVAVLVSGAQLAGTGQCTGTELAVGEHTCLFPGSTVPPTFYGKDEDEDDIKVVGRLSAWPVSFQCRTVAYAPRRISSGNGNVEESSSEFRVSLGTREAASLKHRTFLQR